MASSVQNLQAQQHSLELRIKTLLNEKLKEICKAYGYQVSGNKAVLQKRCLEILHDLVRQGDAQRLDRFKQRLDLGNRDQSLSRNSATPQTMSYPSSGAHQPPNIAAHKSATLNGSLSSRRRFKSSPFYEVVSDLTSFHDLPGMSTIEFTFDDHVTEEVSEMPQNKHSVRIHLTVRDSVAQQFRNGNEANLRMLLYCGQAQHMAQYPSVDVAFPSQVEIKVNDADVKHNFKGLKNKPGSTKPADITALVRKFGEQQNSVTVTYALTSRRYAFAIYLVRYMSAENLTQRIKTGNVIPKQSVLDQMNKANNDTEIEAVSERMSLKDPISTMRITLPVRSSHCTHYQCFDGAMYLQLQEQAPQWSCPICSKIVPFESLCVDKYFEDILNNTSKSIEKVLVEPNGMWKVIREEDDNSQANGASNKPRASYDDDFDDEIIEVEESTNKITTGVKRESLGLMQSPTGPPRPHSFSMNTPPLSSREASVAQSTSSTQRQGNKRPQSSVIDLTLSDDEDDEPPRPAKRHQPTHPRSQGNKDSTNEAYNTPTSIPGRNPQQESRDLHRSSSNRSATDTSGHAAYNQSNLYQRLPHGGYSATPQPNSTSSYTQSAWPAMQSHSPTHPPQGDGSGSMFAPPSPFSIRPQTTDRSSSGFGGNASIQQGALFLPPVQASSTDPRHDYTNPWAREYGSSSNFSQSPG